MLATALHTEEYSVRWWWWSSSLFTIGICWKSRERAIQVCFWFPLHELTRNISLNYKTELYGPDRPVPVQAGRQCIVWNWTVVVVSVRGRGKNNSLACWMRVLVLVWPGRLINSGRTTSRRLGYCVISIKSLFLSIWLKLNITNSESDPLLVEFKQWTWIRFVSACQSLWSQRQGEDLLLQW